MKLFKETSQYADENVDILRSQLIKADLQPVEHISLADIKAELAVITAAPHGGDATEKRLDYLLLCLQPNKEYNLEKEQKRIEKNTIITSFVSESSNFMRGYVAINIT